MEERLLQAALALFSSRQSTSRKLQNLRCQTSNDGPSSPRHSISLPCHKPLLKTDIEILFRLGTAVLITGDLNCKHPSWSCPLTNNNGRKLLRASDERLFGICALLMPTHYPNVRDLVLLKGVTFQLRLIKTIDDIDSDHLPVVFQLGPPTTASSRGRSPSRGRFSRIQMG